MSRGMKKTTRQEINLNIRQWGMNYDALMHIARSDILDDESYRLRSHTNERASTGMACCGEETTLQCVYGPDKRNKEQSYRG